MLKLTRYFSFFGALLILLFTISLMSFLRSLLLKNLKEAEERNGVIVTEVLSNFLLPEYRSLLALPDSVPALELSGRSETRRIDERVRALSKGAPTVVKVKVFNLRGRTVYSSDPTQTGVQKEPSYPGVTVSRTGQITSTLEFRPKFKGIHGELSDIQLLSSYIPLRAMAGGPIEGVFEIYTNVSANHAKSVAQTHMVLGITLLAMIALYLGLLVLVRRGELLIVRQAREIEEHRAALIQSSKLASLGEMAGGVAHEINNPLTILLGRAEQLAKISAATGEIPRDEVRRISANLSETVQRISRVIRGLRSFARESGSDPFTEVTSCQLIMDMLAFCEQKLKSQEIEIQLPKEQGLKIECRPSQIAQVLLNLIVNAGDAVRDLPEKWIRIEVADAGRDVEISVIDSGKGIPPATARRIFDPFFTTKPVGEGTGLGLSISVGILKSHSGSIRLDSASPNTRFVVRLPKKQA